MPSGAESIAKETRKDRKNTQKEEKNPSLRWFERHGESKKSSREL